MRGTLSLRELLLASHIAGGMYPVSLASSVLGVSRQRVHALIREGKLPVERCEGWVLVPWSGIECRLKLKSVAGLGLVAERPTNER